VRARSALVERDLDRGRCGVFGRSRDAHLEDAVLVACLHIGLDGSLRKREVAMKRPVAKFTTNVVALLRLLLFASLSGDVQHIAFDRDFNILVRVDAREVSSDTLMNRIPDSGLSPINGSNSRCMRTHYPFSPGRLAVFHRPPEQRQRPGARSDPERHAAAPRSAGQVTVIESAIDDWEWPAR